MDEKIQTAREAVPYHCQTIPQSTEPKKSHPQHLTIAPTEMGPQFRISGIVYNQGQPLAIINSQLLHEGDSYSGFIITDIQRDSVEFMLNDQRWNLSMHKEDD